MDGASPDLHPEAQDGAGQAAPDLAQTTPGPAGPYAWPPMGQITWPPLPAALDAIMTGPQHPSHNDPLVRPWIDLMMPPPRGPGLLDDGLKLMKGQSSPAGVGQDKVSRFQPQTVNGVDGLNLRVMTPDETGANAAGDPGVVTGSLSRLPPPILQNLRDKGVPWIVAPDSADQGMPPGDWTSQTPPRWPEYKYPDNPASKLDWGDASSITISPTARLPMKNAVIIGTNNHRGDASYNVTLHETGHAHDFNNGMLSMSPEFRTAYEADPPNMTRPDEATKEDPSDAYCLQDPKEANADRAREEAYAEGFARYYGGDLKSLQEDWPAMYRYWEKQDANLQRHLRQKR